MFTSKEVRDYIDYQVQHELARNPIRALSILNALDKAVNMEALTDQEANLCAEGFVWYSNQFPFSESWRIGARHFIESESFGLHLYRVDGEWQNLKNRKVVYLCRVAEINRDRTGWQLVL